MLVSVWIVKNVSLIFLHYPRVPAQWVPWTKVLTDADGKVRIEGPMANLLDILSNVLKFK